jgi:hypothetical protein
MDDMNLGAINGKPFDKELLDSLSKRCEKDFEDHEVIVVPTSHGQALAALRALDIPVEEIEAHERRALHENRPLSVYLRAILRNELAS